MNPLSPLPLHPTLRSPSLPLTYFGTEIRVRPRNTWDGEKGGGPATRGTIRTGRGPRNIWDGEERASASQHVGR